MIFKIILSLIFIISAENSNNSEEPVDLVPIINFIPLRNDVMEFFYISFTQLAARWPLIHYRKSGYIREIKKTLKERYNYDFKVDEKKFYYDDDDLFKCYDSLNYTVRSLKRMRSIKCKLKSIIRSIKIEYSEYKEFYTDLEPDFNQEKDLNTRKETINAFRCAVDRLKYYNKALLDFEKTFHNIQDRILRELKESDENLLKYLFEVEEERFFKKEKIPKSSYFIYEDMFGELSFTNNERVLKQPSLITFYFLEKKDINVLLNWNNRYHVGMHAFETFCEKYGITDWFFLWHLFDYSTTYLHKVYRVLEMANKHQSLTTEERGRNDKYLYDCFKDYEIYKDLKKLDDGPFKDGRYRTRPRMFWN